MPEFVVPDEVPLALPSLPKLKRVGKKKIVAPPKEGEIEKAGLKVLTNVKAQVHEGAKAPSHDAQAPEGTLTAAGKEI